MEVGHCLCRLDMVLRTVPTTVLYVGTGTVHPSVLYDGIFDSRDYVLLIVLQQQNKL